NQVGRYTYVVTNTSPASTDPVTVTSVLDNVLGELLNGPITLAPGGSTTITKTATVPVKNAGATQDNTVTAAGADDEGNTASATAIASVSYTNVSPAISLTKGANVASVSEGGAG